MTNLRIASAPDLIDYLYRVLLDEAEVVHAFQEIRVVTARRRFFFMSDEPVTLGGPFETVAAMIRSEGVREAPTAAQTSSARQEEVQRWTCFGQSWRLRDGEAVLEGAGPA